ncbi:ABC-type multidrug transport system, ATPase and permease component [Filimonas lacunae]|uniref:ABC-type multidrug transport system, ATPase and permease component n=1 Tax=Filimonas lacunae TaxID=477680 RepID=A0A173MDG9_9BACT|nr:ABC transporter ATP-binding protein [Filimonas lacunae]BAV05567.1 transport ATP-binding protein CydD [Filimonas lacunae]SIT29343.1 ABC-type multidrug transport system, ATPase and permease component [Filimonas lacunae]
MTALQPAFYRKLFKGIYHILLPGEQKRFRLLTAFNLFISVLDIAAIALLFIIIRWYTTHWILPAVWPALVLLACFLAKSISGYLFYQAQYRFAFSVSARLSATLLENFMEGEYDNYTQHDTAEFVRRIVYAPVEFAQFILSGAQQLITEWLLIALSVAALLWYNGKLLAIVFFTLSPAVIALYYITKKKLSGIRRHIKTVNENALQYLHEALHGYVESNIYGRNTFFTQRYAGKQQTVNTYIANLQITQGLPTRFFEVFAVLGMCLLILAGKTTSPGHAGDVLTLGAFVAATYKIIPGISRVMNLTAQMNTYQYVLNELAGQTTQKQATTTTPFLTPVISIEARQLSFAYTTHTAFHALNFTLRTGQLRGISAPSGKGKTTLLHVLLGFLTPQSGHVLLNGQPTTAAERKACWQQVAYVKQEPLLLHTSLLNNIVLFEQAYKEEKLQQVLQVTGLLPMLQQHPEGIHQVIAEHGRNISGGQRQRIAIARALYKEAGILLLDEPFNELDEASETLLLQHLQQLARQGKMVVLITHNSQSLSYCDNVITL